MFRSGHIQIVLPLLALALLPSPFTSASEKTSSQNLIADTAQITYLFDQGNQFINGPSDSLLFYSSQALELIHQSEQYLPSETISKDGKYNTLKRLEFRALIELGIEHFYRADNELALLYDNRALEIASLLTTDLSFPIIPAISLCFLPFANRQDIVYLCSLVRCAICNFVFRDMGA